MRIREEKVPAQKDSRRKGIVLRGLASLAILTDT